MPEPPKDDDKLPDAEADARFNRAIKNALATPHTPHKLTGDDRKTTAPHGHRQRGSRAQSPNTHR
jgi:hypothetical protein